MSDPPDQPGREDAPDDYFERIERHFGLRRGGPVLLSPLDWKLVESWHRRGVPLTAVLQGINRAFDRHRHSRPRTERINSLRYCEQEIEAAWRELSERGEPAERTPGRSLDNAASHLQLAADACRRAASDVELPASAVELLGEVADEIEEIAGQARADTDAASIDARAAELEQRLMNELQRRWSEAPATADACRRALRLPRLSPYAV